MTDALKENLTKISLFLRISATICGALMACFVVYSQLDQRMDNIETAKEVAEAVNKEKFSSIEKELGKISDKTVKNGEKSDKIYEYIIKSTKGDRLASRER